MNNANSHRIFPFVKKNRYFNNEHDRLENLFLRTAPLLLCSLYQRKKRLPVNKSNWIIEPFLIQKSHTPRITWIGHASFLIQIENYNILTDPVFDNISFLFPRLFAPGINLEELPPIDVILLSHNHPDHCQLSSLHKLQKLNPNVYLLVSKGDKQWLEKAGMRNVHEFNWWDQFNFNNSLQFMYLPAKHWSARWVFDRNCSLWGSWMISGQNQNIYFGGDTAYCNHFKSIAIEFPAIDVALLPIAPAIPADWMMQTHMDPAQAIQAFVDLNAKLLIPMHWGTFQFGLDSFEWPIEYLQKKWNDSSNLAQKNLSILKIGQTKAF